MFIFSQEQRVSEWKQLNDEINETKGNTCYHSLIEKKRHRFEFIASTLYAAVMPLLVIPTAFMCISRDLAHLYFGEILINPINQPTLLHSMNLSGGPLITFDQMVGLCCGVSGLLLIIVGIIYMIYFCSKKRAACYKEKLNKRQAQIKQARSLSKNERGNDLTHNKSFFGLT